MSVAALAALPCRRPLSAFDRARLESLAEASLPETLTQLARSMSEHDEIEEQEALP
jgi:hypothetical protein